MTTHRSARAWRRAARGQTGDSVSRPRSDAPRLRTLLLQSSVLVTLLALVVLAVPLALYIQSTNTAEATSALEREATRVVALDPHDLRELPAPMDPQVSLGLYDSNGARIARVGPDADSDARGALEEGSTRVKREDGDLAVYVPFDQPGGQQTTVRAVIPESIPRDQTYRAWLLLLLGCGLALLVAGVVAVQRSRVIARPFERIADAATRMRSGDLAVRVGATGVREGDDAGWLLEAASREAAQRIHAEITLAQDANHQVRTPVAAARVTLESALADPRADLRAAADQAVVQLERAAGAIEGVLSLRPYDGVRSSPSAAAGVVFDDVRLRWAQHLRRIGRDLLVVADDDARDVMTSEIVLRESLDILVANAVDHGRGTVRVVAREAAGALVVEVIDEGTIGADLPIETLFSRGTTTRSDGSTGGLGLALARSMAEQAGGRLRLAQATPTTFSLILPEARGA